MRPSGSESGGESHVSLLSTIYVNSHCIESDLGYASRYYYATL